MTSAVRAKKNGFSVRVRHPVTGERFTIRADTERELEAYVRRYETIREEFRTSDLVKAEDVSRAIERLMHGEKNFRITLERATAEYLARPTLANTTRDRTTRWIAKVPEELRAREVSACTPPIVQAYIDGLVKRGLQESTIVLAWWTLRAVVGYAAKTRELVHLPWPKNWKPEIRAERRGRREREALRDVGELVRLLDVARIYDEEEESRGELGQEEPKIATKTMLGLRQGELAGLVWPDVDAPNLRVTIGKQWNGAPTKPRTVDTLLAPPELFALLEQHKSNLVRHRLYKKSGPVFPGPESTPGKPRPYANRDHHEGGRENHAPINIRTLRVLVARAGLPDPKKWTAHSLKDSFATLEQEAHGGDLRSLQARTRHKTLRALLRYLHARSRGPVLPGFQLPPEARAKLLGRRNATPDEAEAASGEGAAPGPSREGPYPSAARSAAKQEHVPQALPLEREAVNVAPLTQEDTESLSDARELVSLALVQHVGAPQDAQTKNETAGGGGFEGHDRDGVTNSDGERSTLSAPKRSSRR